VIIPSYKHFYLRDPICHRVFTHQNWANANTVQLNLQKSELNKPLFSIKLPRVFQYSNRKQTNIRSQLRALSSPKPHYSGVSDIYFMNERISQIFSVISWTQSTS
jgi:hypothetical protein